MAKRSHSGTIISDTNSKSTAENMALRLTVDEVLLKYWKSEPEFIFFNPNTKKYTKEDEKKIMEEDTRIMRTDQVVITELGSELWERAYKTAFADVTAHTIPHYRGTQAFINYILNVDNVDVGLAKNFFSRTLFFHPPNSFSMEIYYWHILNDTFIKLKGIEVNETIFWFSLDSLLTCLKNPEFIAESKNHLFGLSNIPKKQSINDTFELKRTSRTGFRALSHPDKFQRVLVILEYLCELFEADFLYRTETNRFIARQNRALLSQVLWKNASEIGNATESVKKLTQFYVLMENLTANHVVTVHRRLFTVLGETIRFNGYKNSMYPFFGTDSEKFAGEIAAQLYDELRKNKNMEVTNMVKTIRPHWLRLLVCSKFLSYLSCKKYSPELQSVHDVLTELIFLNVKTRHLRTFHATESRLAKKRRKSEDSRLNLAIQYCYEGCVLEQCRTLKKKVRLSRMKVNKTDENGWAPLHRAILLRHEKCVDEILKFQSSKPAQDEKNMRADARLKGYKNYTPIMCALIKEDGNICKLLLEHSGPRLLEDINSHGETAFDLCHEFDVGRMIKSTERGRYSKQTQKFYLTSADVPTVVDLCVQFVESYVMTHRTRDVIERLKTKPPNPKELEGQNCWNPIKWNYDRYEQDINVNIEKVLDLVNIFDGDDKSKNRLRTINLILKYSLNF